jgi:hypothetical protein
MAPFKHEFGAQPAPPPYEADAYAHHGRPRFRRRLQRACTLPVSLALALTAMVSYLCLTIGRESHVRSSTTDASTLGLLQRFEESSSFCASRNHVPEEPDPASRKVNPRWNSVRGQNETAALRNATLFDGESFLPMPVDILFSKGLVVSVSPASAAESILEAGEEYNVMGRFVTPGIVDMHSHHMSSIWPASDATDDTNGKDPWLSGWIRLTCTQRCIPYLAL